MFEICQQTLSKTNATRIWDSCESGTWKSWTPTGTHIHTSGLNSFVSRLLFGPLASERVNVLDTCHEKGEHRRDLWVQLRPGYAQLCHLPGRSQWAHLYQVWGREPRSLELWQRRVLVSRRDCVAMKRHSWTSGTTWKISFSLFKSESLGIWLGDSRSPNYLLGESSSSDCRVGCLPTP